MTLRFALSKLLPIILRLWGVDTATPLARRDSSPDEFARAAARRAYITRPRQRFRLSQESHGSQASPRRFR